MNTSALTFQSKRTSYIKEYHKNGTVLVPGVFSDADLQPVIDDLRTRIHLLAQKVDLCLPHQGSASEIRWLSDCLLQLNERYDQAQGALYDAMSRSRSLHQVCSSEKVHAWVSGLMGERYEIHHRLIVLMSLPGGQWHLAGWHQDWYYNEGPSSTMTFWIPLHDVDKSGGAMSIAKGRHNEGLFPHVSEADAGTKWDTIAKENVDSFGDVWDVDAKKGDLVALHSLTPHTANLNSSPQIRFVLNFRFVDLTDSNYLESDWRTGEIAHARASLGKKES